MQTFSFFIYDIIEKTRLDVYLAQNIEEYSRSYIDKIISEERVSVNGRVSKKSYILKEGDEVVIRIDSPKELTASAEDIPIDVIYEDDDIVIVNKKKGMVVHPAPGNYAGTLVNALLFRYKGSLSDMNGSLRPGIVHRIDKDTSGILVVAKTIEAHRKLTDQFKDHQMTRRYHAIVSGEFKEDSGKIDAPIGRDPKDRKKMAVIYKNSKNAVTNYKVLERFKGYTYVECSLETGRTHQIRVHMAHIGHPLLGDSVYRKGKNEFDIEGQVLFAKVLGFNHPSTGEYLEFEEDLPEYFEEILENLRKKALA